MIDYLLSVEKRMPELLQSLDGWTGRYVTYEKPYVERLFRQDGENRIYLHRILPCSESEAFYHVHPWASAIRLVSGYYEMKIGNKTASSRMILNAGSIYEMTDRDSMHSVRPLDGPTLSLMVTGPVWNENKGIQRSNSDLEINKMKLLFEEFKHYYR